MCTGCRFGVINDNKAEVSLPAYSAGASPAFIVFFVFFAQFNTNHFRLDKIYWKTKVLPSSSHHGLFCHCAAFLL